MAKDQKHDDPEYQARSVALRLLARREHSRYELALKLRQRRIPPDVFDPVLDEYECEGWLDDDRFAEIYTRQRIERVTGRCDTGRTAAAWSESDSGVSVVRRRRRVVPESGPGP